MSPDRGERYEIRYTSWKGVDTVYRRTDGRLRAEALLRVISGDPIKSDQRIVDRQLDLLPVVTLPLDARPGTTFEIKGPCVVQSAGYETVTERKKSDGPPG